MMDHPKGFSISTRNHLLFKEWDLNTYQGLVAALLTTVVLAVILEFTNSITKIVAAANDQQDGKRCLSFKDKLILNTKLSLLQMSRVLIAYILMLCVMTMNLWVYIATMVGAGIGYFFSGLLTRSPPRSDFITTTCETITSDDKCESNLLPEEIKEIADAAEGHASDPLLYKSNVEDIKDTVL